MEGHEAAEFLYSKCAEFVGEVTIVMTGSASLILGLPFCTKDLIPTRVILGIAALRGYNLTPQMICSVRWAVATNVAMAAHMFTGDGDSPGFEKCVGHICMMSGGSFVTREAARSGRRCKIGSYKADEQAAGWALDASPAAPVAPGATRQHTDSEQPGYVVGKATLPKSEIEAAEWLISAAAPKGERIVLVDGALLQRSDIKLSFTLPEPEPGPEPSPGAGFSSSEDDEDDDDADEMEVELPYVVDLEGSAISHPMLCAGLRLLWVEVEPRSGKPWMRYDSISWLEGIAATVDEVAAVRMAFIGESKPVHLFPNHNSSGTRAAALSTVVYLLTAWSKQTH